MKDLKEILEDLRSGKSLVLDTRINQYGEKMSIKKLMFKNGEWLLWEVRCWSSRDYGFGTCSCYSHPSDESYPISRGTALDYIKTVIFEEAKKDEKRLEETVFLTALIEAVDINKIRRRVEDALRKGSSAKIMEVAQLLDIKII